MVSMMQKMAYLWAIPWEMVRLMVRLRRRLRLGIIPHLAVRKNRIGRQVIIFQ
jgi:hypothetical protein